ncbi:hypothetical protein ACSBR1_020970 [Camellia fascicularis]
MLRKHDGQGNKNKGLEDAIHTVFVDDLPKSMDPKGLYALFTKFEVVRDVFIPNKRRKMSRLRFGFVHYSCPVEARMVVQKANGLWCDNRILKVKVAEFVKGKEVRQGPSEISVGRRGVGSTSWAPVAVQGRKSYAQVVSGRGLVANTSITVSVSKILKGCVILSSLGLQCGSKPQASP